MEIGFEKDVNSEYLIVQKQREHVHTYFEEGILHNNRLSNVLHLGVRENNADVYYYMDIQYMKDLKVWMECQGLTKSEIHQMLQNLKHATDEMEAYLLSKDMIFLQPECIYRDLKTDQYKFACIPGIKQDFKQQLSDLLSWLMKAVDYNDKELVSYIFELYRRHEAGENIYEQPIEETDIEEAVVVENAAIEEQEPIVFDEAMTEPDLEEKMPFHSIVVTFALVTLGVTIFLVLSGRTLSFWMRTYTGVYLQPWIWPATIFALGMMITFLSYAFYPDSKARLDIKHPKRPQLHIHLDMKKVKQVVDHLHQVIGS